MVYTLTNKLIKITIRSKGAELISLKTLKPDLEYLWQPDNNSVWHAQSPILFPIIGNLPNDTYNFNNKSYYLTGHGFASQQDFKLENRTDDTLSFSIQATAETMEIYPFFFDLKVSYLIRDQSVTFQYKIKNTDTKIMYFSIGGHPGFRCPLMEQETYNDYKLYLAQTEKIDRIINQNGFLTGETEPFLNNENMIDFSSIKLPRGQRVIILKGLKSDQITLKSSKTNKGVTVQFSGFPYLGLWPIENNPLICIEPWFGLSTKSGIVCDLKHKQGIQNLSPGKEFNASFTVSVF